MARSLAGGAADLLMSATDRMRVFNCPDLDALLQMSAAASEKELRRINSRSTGTRTTLFSLCLARKCKNGVRC